MIFTLFKKFPSSFFIFPKTILFLAKITEIHSAYLNTVITLLMMHSIKGLKYLKMKFLFTLLLNEHLQNNE